MKDLPFGKRTVVESFFNGKLNSVKTEFSIPIRVTNRPEALSEIMKCLELLDSKQTTNITIHVQADRATHEIRLITKEYILDK